MHYKRKPLAIVIDYDGTIVENYYPLIGPEIKDASLYINKLYDEGHYITIFSCRQGKEEQDMIQNLKTLKIKYHTVNQNLPHRIEQYNNDCRKIGGDIYIDDKGLFTPKIDWSQIYWEIHKRLEEPIIICIIGDSGSGKSTLLEYLQNEHKITPVKSHTDRKPRYPKENGHTFHRKGYYESRVDPQDILAYTNFGGNNYWTLRSDFGSRTIYGYIIDEIGYLELLSRSGPEMSVISIHVTRPYDTRKDTIPKERLDRDNTRIALPNELYNYTITNDSTLTNMYEQTDAIIAKIFVPTEDG